MNEEELLTKYLETKDENLFADLYGCMYTRLYAHALQMMKSANDAEDVVQDVFVKLLELEPQEIRCAESFLFRMVWSRAIDCHRHEKAGVRDGMISLEILERREKARMFSNSKEDDEASNFDGIADRRIEFAEGHEYRMKLWKETKSVLAELPDDQRKAVEDYYCHGLTIDEIAEMEGIPWQTIRSRIRRGMSVLRDALAPRNACATIRRKKSSSSRAPEYANAV